MFDIYRLSVNELRLLRIELYYLHDQVQGYKRSILVEELNKINKHLKELTGKNQYQYL